MRFLFVGPEFCPPKLLALTSSFLQIPPHGGHPCLRLTLPATELVVDFHHQVTAHAERTKPSGQHSKNVGRLVLVICRVVFCLIIRSSVGSI